MRIIALFLCIASYENYFCFAFMGCITLLSDFGLQDASVASAKGILMQYVSDLTIVDISHSIEPYHVQQAAYILASAYDNFPVGTCHVVLFDVFAEKEPVFLLCEKDGHYFLAPDNGILSLIVTPDAIEEVQCFELAANYKFSELLHVAGATIAALQKKTAVELELTPHVINNAPVNWLSKTEGNTVECHVIHIDRFENVVINITRSEFDAIGMGRPFKIQFMRDEEINELNSHYSSVKEGEKLCRFNSAGYMEIAINRGKAASLFGLRLHREQHLMYNTIKIFFE
jgi:S-adenosyl-L-methionine hydrolase (adenosine-forming)